MVLVSGANERSVKPFELVTAVAPLIVVVVSVPPDEAAPDPALGGAPAELPEPDDKLPHAATTRAAATTAAEPSQPINRRCLLIPDAACWRPSRAASRACSGGGAFCSVIAVLLSWPGARAEERRPPGAGAQVRRW